MNNRVGVVRGQHVEEELRCTRYVIGASGEGAARLRQVPQKPHPLRQHIFLQSNNNLLPWLLANNGQDPIDLLVVGSRRKHREDRARTPKAAKGRNSFLKRNVWEDAVGMMEADEHENEHEHEQEEKEEWLEAKSEGERQAPPDGGGDWFGRCKY